MKLPAFQFYPGDWMKDPALRRCSHGARGVLVDVICLAFECEERGVLITAEKPWTDEEVAGAIGGNADVTLSHLRELLDKGVLKRRKDGSIYSARMVRDEENRQKTRERVQNHRNKEVKRDCNGDVTSDVTPLKHPSSPSSSPSGNNISTERPSGIPANESEAISWASMENVPADFAKDVFNQCEGVNWKDGANRDITNWRSYIKQRYSKRQEFQPKQAESQGASKEPTVWELTQRLEAKKRRLQQLRNQGSEDPFGRVDYASDKDREEARKLKTEIKEIERKLAQ
jgi:hypothetical protein